MPMKENWHCNSPFSTIIRADDCIYSASNGHPTPKASPEAAFLWKIQRISAINHSLALKIKEAVNTK